MNAPDYSKILWESIIDAEQEEILRQIPGWGPEEEDFGESPEELEVAGISGGDAVNEQQTTRASQLSLEILESQPATAARGGGFLESQDAPFFTTPTKEDGDDDFHSANRNLDSRASSAPSSPSGDVATSRATNVLVDLSLRLTSTATAMEEPLDKAVDEDAELAEDRAQREAVAETAVSGLSQANEEVLANPASLLRSPLKAKTADLVAIICRPPTSREGASAAERENHAPPERRVALDEAGPALVDASNVPEADVKDNQIGATAKEDAGYRIPRSVWDVVDMRRAARCETTEHPRHVSLLETARKVGIRLPLPTSTEIE